MRCKKMTVGEIIKAVHKQSGLSRERFAEQMKVLPRTVTNWEKDRVAPRDKSRKLLAEFIRKHNMNEDWIKIIESE